MEEKKMTTPVTTELNDDELDQVVGGYGVGDTVTCTKSAIEYCEGCGACVKRCGAGALSLVPADTDEESAKYDFSADFIASESIESTAVPKMRAVADDEKCVRCGYCTKVCPVFALKVY